MDPGAGGGRVRRHATGQVRESSGVKPTSQNSWPAAMSNPSRLLAQREQLVPLLSIMDALVKRIEGNSGARDVFWECLVLLPCDPTVVEGMRSPHWDGAMPSNLSLVGSLQAIL